MNEQNKQIFEKSKERYICEKKFSKIYLKKFQNDKKQKIKYFDRYLRKLKNNS